MTSYMWDRKLLDPFFVGFDEMLDRLGRMDIGKLKASTNYPPYNIRKVSDNNYVIELAVAGFGKADIDVTIDGGTLTITGGVKSDSENQVYLFKGIADRSFKRSFTVADTIEIRNAELMNGMLRVWLENMIPDHKKPRKIAVTDSVETVSKKQMLTE